MERDIKTSPQGWQMGSLTFLLQLYLATLHPPFVRHSLCFSMPPRKNLLEGYSLGTAGCGLNKLQYVHRVGTLPILQNWATKDTSNKTETHS